METPLPWVELKIVLIVFFSNFITFASYGITAPFWPKVMEDLGIQQFVIGIIFSVPEIVQCVCSPVVSTLLIKTGYKKAMITGYILLCIPVGLNALLPLLRESTPYIVVSVVLMIIEGIGAAIVETVCFALFFSVIPESKLAIYFGWSEVCTGLGLMLGPPLGGFLYEYTGFEKTFIINALFIAVPVIPFFLWYQDNTTPTEDIDEEVSLFQVFKVLWVWLVAIASAISIMTITALDPTLELHLIPLNLSPLKVGLLFLVPSFFYMVLGPIVGNFVDIIGGKSIILMGLLLQSIGMLFIGPAPFVPYLKNDIWENIVGLILLGIGTSFSIIPALTVLTAETSHISGNIKDTLAGLLSSLFAFGAFLGPNIGSSLSQMVGFPWCCGILGCVLGFIVLIYFAVALKELWEYSHIPQHTPSKEYVSVNDDP